MKDAKFVRIDEDGRHVYRLPSVIHNVDIRIDISEDPEVIEVKTTELIGPALDWAVLFAGYGDGPDCRLIDGGLFVVSLHEVVAGMDGIDQQEKIDPFWPSTRWQDGGPLLTEFSVEFEWVTDATIRAFTMIDSGVGFGSDHLVAACRAIVAAKLGDTVSVPRELMQ